MNSIINKETLSSFSPKSKVWIYQSSRPLSVNEYESAIKMIETFVTQWTSHSTKVKGFGTILLNHFIVLIADETTASVSGCSTDSSVRLIKEIEKNTGINFFDRQNLAFQISNEIRLIPLTELNAAIIKEIILPETLYYNNLISTLDELYDKWLIRIDQSWLATKYNFLKSNAYVN